MMVGDDLGLGFRLPKFQAVVGVSGNLWSTEKVGLGFMVEPSNG